MRKCPLDTGSVTESVWCSDGIPLLCVKRYIVNWQLSVAVTDEPYLGLILPDLHYERHSQPQSPFLKTPVLDLTSSCFDSGLRGWAQQLASCPYLTLGRLSSNSIHLFLSSSCSNLVTVTWDLVISSRKWVRNTVKLIFNSQTSSSHQPRESGSYLSIKTSACAVV